MSVEDQSFIFSQNGGGFTLSHLLSQQNQRSSSALAKEIGLNCLCIIFTDLICLVEDFAEKVGSEEELRRLLQQDRIVATKRAFCLMFTNSLY